MEPAASPNELACEELLLRLALKKDFISTDSVDAFLLRPSDHGKLSVFRLSLTNVDDCSGSFNKVHGSFSLHTGHVRALAESDLPTLEVVIDESAEDKCPGHTSIRNLPDPQVDFELAQRAASLLKRHARRLT